MTRKKVAQNERRNFKASPGKRARDFGRATMTNDSHKANAAKNVGSTERSPARMESRGKSRKILGSFDAKQRDYAVQRYADLYDFAPTGYVSFDRSGRIEEINLTATKLFGVPRERLIGMPFTVFVDRNDLPLFLHHLLRCRCADAHVETELRLRSVHRDTFEAQLCSVPIDASLIEGRLLFQTAIIDLTERKRAEKAILAGEAKLARDLDDARKLQNVSSQLVRQEDIEAVYQQIVEATVALLGADGGSLQVLAASSNELCLIGSKGFDPETVDLWKHLPV